MASWIWIDLWGFAFAATHIVLSSLGVRRPLLARLGPLGFQALYSLVAFATFIPFVSVWWGDRHGGPLWWHLREVPGLRELCIVLSVLGFVLMVLALIQPSPASLVPGGSTAPRGVSRITRHALFMGVALLAGCHVLMNGWASDVAFFGWLALFSVVGSLHQDARKRALDDGSLAEFYATTSVVPFGAILAGRQKLVLGELSPVGIVLGAAAGIGLFLLHAVLFGQA